MIQISAYQYITFKYTVSTILPSFPSEEDGSTFFIESEKKYNKVEHKVTKIELALEILQFFKIPKTKFRPTQKQKMLKLNKLNQPNHEREIKK